MPRATIAGGAFATVLILIALAIGLRAPEQGVGSTVTTSPAISRSTQGTQEGLIHGRVTTDDGNVYEGRLRFGGDEEALWGNHFNGFRDENPWVDHAPLDQLPRERLAWTVFGVTFAVEPRYDLGRPFMARFGDITRIEARGRDLRVTLKSGTVFHLDRYAADDFADGVRVWDGSRGIVDLGEGSIRSIELIPTAGPGNGPAPLHGTVRTHHGEFSGFIQWDREACLGADYLHGHSAESEVDLRFDEIRSIARRSREGAIVTLLDGRELVLSDTRRDGRGNRGMYVDDARYGRVLISWDAFERVDFSPGDTAPGYGEFRPGQPLTGSVVTRSGRRLTGRLVYDLDESETTETLDAPSHGVDYTIPFALIDAIEPLGSGGDQGARVTLRSGEVVQLERAGDLAEWNAGMLVFTEGRPSPAYVSWAEVARIDLDRAPAM